MSEERERPPAKSIEETLAEVNSVLIERYPIEVINFEEGRQITVCSASAAGSSVVREGPEKKGGNIIFVVKRARLVHFDHGKGDEEGKVSLVVGHIGWNSYQDAHFAQEGDVFLIRKGDEDFVVSLLKKEPQHTRSGLWTNFTVKPVLSEQRWEISDSSDDLSEGLSEDRDKIIGRVVRVEGIF